MAAFEAPDWLTPSELFDMIGQAVADAYADAELALIAALAKRAGREGILTDRAEQRLADVRALRKAAQEALRHLTPELAVQLVQVAERAGIQAAVEQLELIPRLPSGAIVTGAQANAVALTLADLGNVIDQMHQRILRWDVDEYQALIAGQVPLMNLGIAGTVKTQRKAVAKWLREGIPAFQDRAGRFWKPGSYAEMAVRTAARRAFVDASVNRMHEAGIGLVTVVVGNSACELCAPWIDKVLSTDGTLPGPRLVEHAVEDRQVLVEVAATLEQARAQGLMHPNCRCTVVAYLPGLSIPSAATQYNPEREAARDAQRTKERRLRQLKRELAATLDPADAADLKQRIRDGQADIRDHIAANELPRMAWREQPWWADGAA